MAASLEGTSESKGESQIDDFIDYVQLLRVSLRQKKLIYIADAILKAEELTLEQLMKCTRNELSDLLADIHNDKGNDYKIKASRRIKFAETVTNMAAQQQDALQKQTAIPSTPNININVPTKNISKTIRITITQQEEKAMDELNEYNTYISSLINQLSKKKKKFIRNHKKTKSQINAQFNNLITLINNNQEIVLKKLDTILQNNQSVIDAKSQELQKALKTAQNTMKACDESLDNAEINKYERKKNVLAMTNNILKAKIQKDVVDISTNIFFEFNTESISPFLSDLVYVSDFVKQFVYKSDYDTNGICYYLGTNFGTEKWVNPSKRGLIKLHSVNKISTSGGLDNIVCRTKVSLYSAKKKGGCITLDFGEKLKIKPNCYTIMHSENNAQAPLRHWNFEGSNDNNNWIVLKQHINDTTLKKAYQTHTFPVDNCNSFYQHFRIKMTGKNAQNNWYFVCAGFEIYGYLTGNK